MHKCGILIKEFSRYEVILGLFEGVCTNLEYRGVDVHKSGNGSPKRREEVSVLWSVFIIILIPLPTNLSRNPPNDVQTTDCEER